MSELTREQLLEYVKKQKVKIKKLESEITDLKSHQSIGSDSVTSLGDELKHSQDFEDALKIEIQTLEEESRQKSVDIYRLTKRVETLEGENLSLQTRSAELVDHSVVVELQTIIESLSNENRDLIEKLEFSNERAKDLKEIFQESEKTRDSESHKLNESFEHIKQLQAQLQLLKSDFDYSKSRVIELESAISEKDKELSLSFECISTNENIESQLNNTIKSLKLAEVDLKNENVKLSEELIRVRSELESGDRESSFQLSQIQSHYQTLQHELELQSSQVLTLQRENKALKEELLNIRVHPVNDLSESTLKESVDLKQRIDNMMAELTDYNQRIASLSSRVRDLEEINLLLSNDLEAKVLSKVELQEEISTLKLMIENQWTQSNNEMNDKQAMIVELCDQIRALEKKYQDSINDSKERDVRMHNEEEAVCVALTFTNQELNNKIQSLTSQLDENNSTIQHLNDNLSSLQENFDDLLNEYGTLQETSKNREDSLTATTSELTGNLSTLRSNFDDLSVKYVALENANRSHLDQSEETISELKDKILLCEDQTKEANNCLSVLKSDRETLLAQVADYSDSILTLKNSVATLVDANKAFSGQIDDYNAQNTLLLSSNTLLNDQTIQANSSICELKSEIERLKYENSHLLARIDSLDLSNKSLNSEMASLLNENIALQELCNQLKQEMQSECQHGQINNQERLKSLESSVADKSVDGQSVWNLNVGFSAAISEQDTRLCPDNLEAQLNRLNEEISEIISNKALIEHDRNELVYRLANLVVPMPLKPNKKNKKKQQPAGSNSLQDELNASISAANQQLSEAETRLQELIGLKASLTLTRSQESSKLDVEADGSESEELKAKNDVERIAGDMSTIRLMDKSHEIDEESTINELTVKVQDLNRENAELKGDASDLNNSIRLLTSESNELQKQLAATEELIKELRLENHELREVTQITNQKCSELSTHNQELTEKCSRETQTLLDCRDNLIKEINSLTDELKQSRDESTRLMVDNHRLCITVSDSNEKYAKLRLELDAATTSYNTLNEEYQKLNESFVTQHNRLDESDLLIRDLQSRLLDGEVLITKATSELDSVIREKVELTEKYEILSKKQSVTMKKLKAATDEVKSLKVSTDTLSDTLSSKESELSLVSKEVIELIDELQLKALRLDESLRNSDALRLQITELTQTIEEMKFETAAATQSTMSSLQGELASSQAYIIELESSMSDFIANCATLQQEVHELRSFSDLDKSKTRLLAEHELRIEELSRDNELLKQQAEMMIVQHQKQLLDLEAELSTKCRENMATELRNEYREELTGEISKQVRLESAEVLKEVEDSYQIKISELTRQLHDQFQLSQLNDIKYESLTQQLTSAQNQVETIQIQLKSAQEHVLKSQESESQLRQVQEQLSESNERCKLLENQILQLQSHLEVQKDELLLAQSQVVTAEGTETILRQTIKDQLESTEQLRLRVISLEDQLETSHKQTEQLQAQVLRLSSMEEMLNTAHEQLQVASQGEENNKGLMQQLSQLQSYVEEQNKEHGIAVESLNEKLKRVKTLLSRTKNLLADREQELANQKSELSQLHDKLVVTEATVHEKDSQIEQLRTATLRPPENIRVLTQLAINARIELIDDYIEQYRSSSDDREDIWMLIVEVEYTLDNSNEPNRDKVRWILRREVEAWLAAGSTTIVGDIPQLLNQQYAALLERREQRKDEDIRDLLAQLQELNSTFAAYKTRAQAALKRLTAAATPGKIAKEAEIIHESTIEIKLPATSSETTPDSCVTLISNGISNQNETLLSQLNDLTLQIQEKDKLLECLEAKVNDLTRRGETVSVAVPSMPQHDSGNESGYDSALSGNNSVGFEFQSEALTMVPDVNLINSDESEHELRKVLEEFAGLKLEIEALKNENKYSLSQIELLEAELTQANKQLAILTSNASAGASTPRYAQGLSTPTSLQNGVDIRSSSRDSHHDTPSATHYHTTRKLVLLQEADNEVSQTLISLREQNGSLNAEILDLKALLADGYEKLATQADQISDLQAALSRELEFNASGRHINAEYLVNVIKKFFLSADASERSKLVAVICSLLHLQQDETQLIVSKWTPTAGRGGLVSWLLPQPTSSVTASRSDVIRGEYIDR